MKHFKTRIMIIVTLMIPAIISSAQVPPIKKAPAIKETPAIKRNVPAVVPGRTVIPQETRNIDLVLGKLFFTSPKDGDHLVAGQEFIIRWSATGNVPEKCVKIAYVQAPFGPFEINPRVCVNGYRWNVPQNMRGNNNYIQLTTLDEKIKAISGPFSVISSKPDLSVESMGTTPAQPTTLNQNNLKLNVTIINGQGGRAVPSQGRITFSVYASTTPYFTKIFDVPALNFGERYAYSMSWPPGVPLIPGGFSFKVDLDIANVSDEEAEDNNHYDKYVLIDGHPNLIVCVKDHMQAVTTREEKLTAIIKNTGEISAGTFVARWWIEGHGTQTYNIPYLTPGHEYEITRRVTWLTGGTDNFTVEADKDNQLTELSETDNIKSGTIHRHVWGTPVAPYDNSPHCP